jgi:hypothetical protein
MNAPLLLAKARPRIILWNNLLQVIVMPIAFYVGTRYGLAGVSIAWLITWPILFAIVTWQTLSLIGLTFADYIGALRHCLTGSIVMVTGVMLAQGYLFGGLSPSDKLFCCALGSLCISRNGLFNRAIHEALSIVKRR